MARAPRSANRDAGARRLCSTSAAEPAPGLVGGRRRGALVAGDRPGPEDARDRLVAALLDERAAVLEVDVRTARGVSADSAAAPAALAPGDLLPDLFAGLLALRRDAGAGPVVALGYGAGGRAALLAAGEPVAVGLLGPGGPRFAAAAALGPGRPAFAAGAPPPPEAAWRSRAPLLCATLGALVGAPGTGSDGRAAVSSEAAERDCAAALAPAAAPPIRAPALVPVDHKP